ncbi:cell division protein FtsI/penicillin-binding protein 2 [Croceifilum oryzae]|uniref:Cell division protein FtsI/penicillin-binding protein 2 n=1 Tax=Croceifilum oryzae TaxID=1553429 RepID=A0AAJ1TFY1_9BACL|nr:penicillin-binding transpeptidase domain-containing protein [Croceifilum oryzae]MDQ0417794.1 cell division protein FtsI/penicillin-binding protein 2 [Croceifilum oryzae]
MTKRTKWIPILFVLLFSLIIARLYQIQVVSTRAFSSGKVDLIALAEQTQSREILLDSGRGVILDRRGVPLVGKDEYQLLVFPQSKQQWDLRQDSFQQLSSLLDVPLTSLQPYLEGIKQPALLARLDKKAIQITPERAKQINDLQIPGLQAVMTDQRYSSDYVGSSIIGRIGRSRHLLENRYAKQVEDGTFSPQSRVGLSGLESSFEVFLHSEKENIKTYVKDGQGRALTGSALRWKEQLASEQGQYMIQSTIDYEIQAKVEQFLADEKVEDGAVVVQDISTGDLVALGSIPTNGVKTKTGDSPWENRAWLEANPGSIFKIVTATAALEEGIVKPNTPITCSGILEPYHLKDASNKAHGKQSFTSQFADSCNITLGQLGEKLGGSKLQSYAENFGLGRTITWQGQTSFDADFEQIEQERPGKIYDPRTPKTDKAAAVYTSIGQQDTKITPIQAANMVTALFHKGRAIRPRIVTEVRDQSGKAVATFPNTYLPTTKQLKDSSLQAVRQMMRAVVTEGTAASVRQAKWALAGKTGTAQIGESKLYDKWMVGFGPYQTPIYSVAVLLRQEPDSNDPRAIRIFQKVMDFLYDYEKQKAQDQKDQKKNPVSDNNKKETKKDSPNGKPKNTSIR